MTSLAQAIANRKNNNTNAFTTSNTPEEIAVQTQLELTPVNDPRRAELQAQLKAIRAANGKR